jgi:catechol 2,3-dioxygenase-like lactoylglutathione lyase family enzyme
VAVRRRGAPAPRLHHLALRVADCERARAFYSGLLGLPEVRRIEEGGTLRAVWVAAGETVIMLERALRGAGAPSGSGHVLALAAGDLAVWEARLAAARVPLDDRTPETLFVRDPDGHRVGLSVHRFPHDFFAARQR